jgi:hypothetical protein
MATNVSKSDSLNPGVYAAVLRTIEDDMSKPFREGDEPKPVYVLTFDVVLPDGSTKSRKQWLTRSLYDGKGVAGNASTLYKLLKGYGEQVDHASYVFHIGSWLNKCMTLTLERVEKAGVYRDKITGWGPAAPEFIEQMGADPKTTQLPVIDLNELI